MEEPKPEPRIIKVIIIAAISLAGVCPGHRAVASPSWSYCLLTTTLWGPVLTHFTDEESGAPRGEMPFLMPQPWQKQHSNPGPFCTSVGSRLKQRPVS